MITAQDLDYHHSDGDDYTWAETYYIPISVPEERIFAHVYVVTRPVLGVMSNDIRIQGAISESEFELLYLDSHTHLPAPERFSQIDSPAGLSVVAVNPPRDYRVDYVGHDGVEIHVDYEGIMHPWDIHDPELNPLAGRTEGERLAATSMGSGYKGHFDMHARVRGTLSVRGRRYAVDVVDRMNHSWGPRPERGIPPMNSGWAQFGEELGLRFHLHLDPTLPAGQDQRLAHGYVLDAGEVHAITDLEMTATRLGTVVIQADLVATDARGKRFALRGRALTGSPWRAYPTAVTWFGLWEWEHEGTIGHGSLQENHNLATEGATRGRRWSDVPPAISS
jgi:hypothetical protein